MRLSPVSFNSFLFQQNTRVSSDWAIPFDWNITGISTTDVPRSLNYPNFAAKNYDGNIKVININFNDVDFDRDSFVKAMDVLGEDQHQLLAADEFGREWYVNAVCIGLNEDSTSDKTASFGAIFAIDDPLWKKLILSTHTILVNGTGSGTITPIGNQPALPIIKVTPTAFGVAPPGFAYKRFIQIINNSPNALTSYPLNLTGAGLNTAALVSGGKMLANGDDLRIFVDGVEVKRWFGGGGINSTTTKIWINWTQPANSNMLLDTAIASSGAISTIRIKKTASSIAQFPGVPVSGMVEIDSEIFVYRNKDEDATDFILTNITRAAKLTTAAAHASNATIYFVTHGVWMCYGNPTITPYVVDDTHKPLIDLVNSTNTSHVYAEFTDNTGNRTGRWTQRVISANAFLINGVVYQSQNYTHTHGSFINPGSLVGTLLAGPGNLGWKLYNPIGITDVATAGEKFAYTSIFNNSMRSSPDGLDYSNEVYNEAAPTPLAWTASGTGGTPISLGVTHYYLYFRSYIDVLQSSSNWGLQYNELTDVTVTLYSPQAPSITISSENSSFHLHSFLTNGATGEVLEIEIVMSLDTYITINTKEKTVTLYDGSNEINAIQNMPVRPEWFELLPDEDNVINITDEGHVTFEFSYEDRYL